jgi:hypothetical protein
MKAFQNAPPAIRESVEPESKVIVESAVRERKQLPEMTRTEEGIQTEA